jgi:hypothetical protein
MSRIGARNTSNIIVSANVYDDHSQQLRSVRFTNIRRTCLFSDSQADVEEDAECTASRIACLPAHTLTSMSITTFVALDDTEANLARTNGMLIAIASYLLPASD